MIRILLDTSAYIASSRVHAAIRSRMEEADEIALSVISLGELLAGFRKGSAQRSNEMGLQKFLDSPRIVAVPATTDTAQCYAVIKDSLRKAGAPVSANDLWIAATAMEHGYRLVTTDADFRKIPQIVVEHHPA